MAEVDIGMVAILVTLTIMLVGLTFAFLGMQLIRMQNEIKRLTAAVSYEMKEGGEKPETETYTGPETTEPVTAESAQTEENKTQPVQEKPPVE